MKISIAADHGGFPLKDPVVKALRDAGYEVEDFGTFSPDSVDYPDYAKKVGNSVKHAQSDIGILICTTGIGMSIAANKMIGIRAALAHNEDSAEFGRRHNNANVLCMGAKYLSPELASKMAVIFAKTQFEAGRHERRVAKFDRMNLD